MSHDREFPDGEILSRLIVPEAVALQITFSAQGPDTLGRITDPVLLLVLISRAFLVESGE